MSKEFSINKEQAAYMLGVDVRTLTAYQNRKRDPLPIKKKGKRGTANHYDPREILEWKIRQRVGEVAPPSGREFIDFDQENARLTKEKADGAALKNAQLRRELVPIDAVVWAMSKAGKQIASILETIPGKVKRRVPRLNATEVEIIKREVIKAQNVAAHVSVDLDEYADAGTENAA